MKSVFDKVVKVLSGVAAAVLAVPFFAFNVSADSYYGITIDGSFSDWDSVIKYDCLSESSRVNNVAMVWDGD
jgi:hypothetical protein